MNGGRFEDPRTLAWAANQTRLVHEEAGWRASTQESRKGGRWAYVIDVGDMWPYVSHHKYHSPEAALAAGIEDARATDLDRQEGRS